MTQPARALADPPRAPEVAQEAGAPPAPALRGHRPALDGVRGLAILMVLLLHFVGQSDPTTPIERALCWVMKFGAFGVELFFVLSGFLITGILYDSCTRPRYFRNFYMRRVLRIFPLYYGVLAVVFFVVPLFPFFRGRHLDFLLQHQAWAWLYGVNVYIAKYDWDLSYIDHFWSLCVEEHFYLAWPLVVWALRRRPRALLWLSFALAVGAMAARLVANVLGISWWTTYVLTPFRLDGLALGAFLAVWARRPGGAATIARHVVKFGLVAAGATTATYAYVLVSQRGLLFLYPVRVAFILLVLASLLMWALVAPERSLTGRFFRSRWMAVLGTYSYGLYVYHHFISYYIMDHRIEHVLARSTGSHLGAVVLLAAGGGLASFAMAYVSYHVYEKPFLSLKRLFEAGR